MTFKAYIDTLYGTKSFGKNKRDFAYALFHTAGPKEDVSKETVGSWLWKGRTGGTRRYFPDEMVDEKQFINYLKSRTKDRGAWKKLQKAFSSQETLNPNATDFRIDLSTENPDDFYWSLLNQFQRIFQLPESERKVETPVLVQETPPRKPSDEQVRNAFLRDVEYYGIMEIINRKPALLNRDDSAHINAFLGEMDILAQYRTLCDISLNTSMDAFINALRIQALILDANLNIRFSSDNEDAAIQMEDNEDCNEYLNSRGLPELTPELIDAAHDSVGLCKTGVSEWGNFRDKVNLLVKDISSWEAEGKP